MKISQKLKLNSLIVLTLIALNIIVTISLVNRMMKDTRQLAEVEEAGRYTRFHLDLQVDNGFKLSGPRDEKIINEEDK